MNRQRILIVDDEENFLRLMTRTLTKEGYEVKTALDVQEALQCLEEERFDLAVIDIVLVSQNGLVILDEIKRRYSHTKVIMITAYPTDETRVISSEKGVSAYLTKPIDIKELKEVIRIVLPDLDKRIPEALE